MTRRKSVLFDTMHYELIISEKKYFALCFICKQELSNTAEERLKSQRRCPVPMKAQKRKSSRESSEMMMSTSTAATDDYQENIVVIDKIPTGS